MKHNSKHILPLIFFVMHLFHVSATESEGFFNYAEFKTNASLEIPKSESDSEKALDISAGIKLSLKNAEFRFYETMKGEIPVQAEDLRESLKSPRYGVKISFFQESAPLTVKAGKNSYSKSISKIKSPSPSTSASPIPKSFSFSTGINSTLPTLTSSEQPLSASANFTFPEKIVHNLFKIDSIFVDAFLDEEMNSAFSVSASKKIGAHKSVQAAFTGTRFFIENNSTVLKKTDAAFSPDFFLSGLSEFSLRTPALKTNARIAIHESPYEKNSIWLSISGRSGFKNFLTDFSFYAIPTAQSAPKTAPLIGSNSSIQRTILQAGINPQAAFFIGDGTNTLRTGIHAIAARKITSTKAAEKMTVGKMKIAESFENKRFSLRHDFTLANVLLKGNPPNKSTTPEKYFANELTASLRTKKATFSSDISHKYVPPYDSRYEPKQIFSASAKAAIGKAKSFSAGGKFSVTMTGDERSDGDAEAWASYKIKSKKISASAKCGISTKF